MTRSERTELRALFDGIRLAIVLALSLAVRSIPSAAGDWPLHCTYDAMGRLARLQRPLAGYLTGGLGGAYNARQARLAAEEAGILGVSQRSTRWTFGANHSTTQWQYKMSSRGWTAQQITEAIGDGAAYSAQNNIRSGNPATRYVHPSTGQSVVIDDITMEVIHLGGPGFKY